LISVVAMGYLLGVSTRRVGKLVETLGIGGISKSQVSRMAKILDVQPGVAVRRRKTSRAEPGRTCGWVLRAQTGSRTLMAAERALTRR
jgi:hypothetical protein